MYKTSGLGCWRDDGMLEYHGRIDDQVKIAVIAALYIHTLLKHEANRIQGLSSTKVDRYPTPNDGLLELQQLALPPHQKRLSLPTPIGRHTLSSFRCKTFHSPLLQVSPLQPH